MEQIKPNVERAIIIGAGPCGLSAALELQAIGIEPLLIEKNAVVHSIYQYPTYMQFFSTSELLEIGGIPFTTPNDKPTRREALQYYRDVALRRKLRIHAYESAASISRLENGSFRVETVDRFGSAAAYEARFVVVATGYFDHPNLLGIPGEELSKVTHFFQEAHPYTGMKVAIIGGNNSAVDAAMELLRVGADITVVYRGDDYSPSIKPWVKPLFASMVAKGKIRMLFSSRVIRIDESTVTVQPSDPTRPSYRLDNDFVLALTGFQPERTLLTDAGAHVDAESTIPEFNPETMETNIPGLFIAGVIAAGREANEIFIESGRHHGTLIARRIQQIV
ncbi:YpdA family putative bacillithiol disulfide reductase [Cohnella luojiensis]|uniref:YpdA family putative bacillithiol disulfide reductase n=1 Tax=Cohnella luojiensis TaxID=652876 RepID=A0A4Y8M4Y9_9BACL|nr:YpdA family putative bacillithiol disulfide reductase [Cohnella luojiensis]TFE29431.1 YpdA family putative bacillithiol disulfide reductase [Cohnella luojiensis]